MAYLRLTITDTLGFWDNDLEDYTFNPQHSKTLTIWYKLPDEWFGDGGLLAERREFLLQHLYGGGWRLGNGDGSRYVVLALAEHRLSLEEVAERPWLQAGGSCYALGENGTLAKVESTVL